MLKCINTIPKYTPNSKALVSRRLVNKRFNSSSSSSSSKPPPTTPPFFSSTEPTSPILTELVYGRKRIYTSLQTIGKTKSATASKTCIASPVTSSPMSWEWIQPAEENHGHQNKNEWYQLKQKKRGGGISSIVNSFKQNMREMFLPVG
jgi:hypothetical protein